jgi:hypothetical protein
MYRQQIINVELNVIREELLTIQLSLDMTLCRRVYDSRRFEGQWRLHFEGWVNQEEFFLELLTLNTKVPRSIET